MSSEKALNELKKATLASYLAKAPRMMRADDKIAADFDRDVGHHMKISNQHSLNVYTPGFEKDPEKYAAAEKAMRVNADLRNTFKRGANNRIKGIARAGRLLAKEDAVNEAGKNPYGPGYKLVDKDGKQLQVGHKFLHTSHHEGSKPEHHEITGWQSGEQRGNSSSSGRVAVKVGKGKKAYSTEYFPHVFGMKVVKEGRNSDADADEVEVKRPKTPKGKPIAYKDPEKGWVGQSKEYYDKVEKARKGVKEEALDEWKPANKPHGFQGDDKEPTEAEYQASLARHKAAHGVGVKKPSLLDKIKSKLRKEEVIDEVSRSTIAKVATARFNQAQAALKNKDFGGYVKGMKKAIKAGDATTPKTGWSPEDDKKEEVVISPQEKYRQIREAKLRTRKGK
jgi:hypothetical protein